MLIIKTRMLKIVGILSNVNTCLKMFLMGLVLFISKLTT